MASNVAHTLINVRHTARAAGFDVCSEIAGLVEIHGDDLAQVVGLVANGLTSVERNEARALLSDLDPSLEAATPGAVRARLLAAALRAPSLAQLASRVVEIDLADLIDDELEHFYSVYQPIVTLADGAVIGHEALLRATGPAGPLMPDDMFSAASRAGWLHTLDRIGRTTALRGAAGWLSSDWLFVNFIPTSIYRPELCLRTTERAALDAGLDLEQVVFELTESEEVRDLDHLERVFGYYKSRGCRVALDDVGSGFSSLNLMVRLQPDLVKIDRDTVQQLPGKVASAVVGALVDIARASGILVLAEGIETEEQAAAARELGCHLGQGWYFGRPELRTERARTLAAATAGRSAPDSLVPTVARRGCT